MNQSSAYQQIEIFISGRQLRDKDVFSKSDPFVIVSLQTNNQWYKLGQTETVDNNLNPNFTKSFQVDYVFEVKQPIKFEVRDDDGNSSEYLGQVETTIGNLFGAKNQTSILELGKGNGKLVIRCDRVTQGNEHILMKWSGHKLMNTDGWFGKSDPLLRFHRERDDGTFVQVHQTETVMNNLNPIWQPIDLLSTKLASSNDKRIKIECWDWEKSGSFQFIGDFFTTIIELKTRREFPLNNPKKKNPGLLRIDQFNVYTKPSFIDYIRGGLQLNLVVAVDFTASNGNPQQSNSLHFRNPSYPNQYQVAMQSVGEILLAYDYDKLVPCYGFGANICYPTMRSNQAVHCFPLSGDPNKVDAFGLEQMLGLYNYALNNVQLSGPTYFGPLIQETMKIAAEQKRQEMDAYTILLILTDGDIHDMELTKDLLVNSAQLPYSVIIVGVGTCDFRSMEELDGDDGLYSKGRKAQRDLVQFVPYKNFANNQVNLARHVLAEIPDQIVKYMLMVGKQPRPPLVMDINQLGYSVVPQQIAQPPLLVPDGIPQSQIGQPQYGQQIPPQFPQQPPPIQSQFGQQPNFQGTMPSEYGQRPPQQFGNSIQQPFVPGQLPQQFNQPMMNSQQYQQQQQQQQQPQYSPYPQLNNNVNNPMK